jgi:hypothetical protein
MRRITSLLVCVLFVLALAVPVYAQSPTQDAYEGIAGVEQGGGGSSPSASGGGDGSLPFTGLELAVVALAGAGLVGAGFAVRRATHLRESSS